MAGVLTIPHAAARSKHHTPFATEAMEAAATLCGEKPAHQHRDKPKTGPTGVADGGSNRRPHTTGDTPTLGREHAPAVTRAANWNSKGARW
mmetsp:Transcript_1530/g.4009  ORF Transcript_1530/g.4009 Transcript_1530/m.4009 type:complete len:91 (+) Transcript_1530:1085-1357(+)